MQLRLSLLITTLAGALLMVPATASAYFVHVVAPGESLFSIAATDGLTVDQLAAANGLSPTTQLITGSTLQIPPQGSGTAVASSSGSTAAPVATSVSTGDGDNDADDVGSTGSAAPASSGGAYVVQPGDTLTGIASRAGLSPDSLAAANGLDVNGVLISGTVLRLSGGSAAAPTSTTVPVSMTSSSSSGAYVVQPGDTLTAIATRAGVSMPSLAAANGLDPNRVLVSGTVLHLSGSPGVASSASAAISQPVGTAAEGTPTDPPYPTPERVTAPQVGSIAAQNGVPASLAAAIAWQESGFNNDLVSSADARGVMQILPGTWQWIQNSLDTGGPPLAPASASDNVRGGVLMLHSLLNATGGDPAMAAAGYYQGLPSVQQHGMYPDTQRYVQDVLSLERQFGGGG
ncbi:MAG TPA: LysM peptidoglycan-binding domain-containing protein [Solirubrobacteraceae bacterium]|nr:LysM peptidoglycan-binding domain-containing protein [Solirubrobacteraceae bacterium]